jgi:hypothetical protein
MVGTVNTRLMAICEPDDWEHAELVAEYLTQMILSQAEDGTSGAASWVEKLF